VAVLEPLLRHRSVSDATMAWLAVRVDAQLQDVLITNQARLLAAPVIVERLFENPHLSTDIRRRADEFLEEFFLKKMRAEEEGFDDVEVEPEVPESAPEPKISAKAQAQAAEADGGEDDEKKSLVARVATMTIVQKIRLAWRGNKEERMFLVRDSNRLVTAAVLKSPKTREAEAEVMANMKSVSEDVLRGIAFRKQWMRKYSIMSAIVKNARSPIDITLPLILKLTLKDQKLLATDRNIPEAVRATARREVARKDSA
jgi:hypothetical protein